MKGFAYLLVAVVAITGVVVYMADASGRSDEDADPIFGIKIPSGYRDCKLTRDNVGSHTDLLTCFPYVGSPHKIRSAERVAA